MIDNNFKNLDKDWRNFTASSLKFSDTILEGFVFVSRKNNSFHAELSGEVTKAGEKIKIQALSNKHNWIEFEGTVYALPFDISEVLSELKISENTKINYSKVLHFYRNRSEIIRFEFAENIFKSANKKAYNFPLNLKIRGLKANLFDYQKRGIQFLDETLKEINGVLLADEMGLGKTLQIIAVILLHVAKSKGPVLILCPTSLIDNWARELEKFAPELDYLIHRGPHRTGSSETLENNKVVITTYDTVINDFVIFEPIMLSFLVCDEAQMLKNPESIRRKTIGQLRRVNTIPVTGTPMENRLLDLYSLVDLAVPNILGNQEEFEARFFDSKNNADALRQILDPVILKRNVADVAGDLPERIDIDIPISLNESLARQYVEILEETLDEYRENGPLVATTRLSIFCAHPDLNFRDDNNEDVDLITEKSQLKLETPKLQITKMILEEAFVSNQKVLIFVLYNQCGSIIQEAMKASENAYWNTINGSTPQEDRQKIIDEFSEVMGPACLILNPKAAGAGLNITAATVVIHFTQNWNPAIEMQASARAYRRGQKKAVRIYRLFYKDTVEEVMIARALWKRELGNEAVPISTRDNSDLANVISLNPMEHT